MKSCGLPRLRLRRQGRPKMRWISVSERLPDPGEMVLVRNSAGYIGSDWHDGQEFQEISGATHWMPWPAQPDEVLTLADKMKLWGELREWMDELEAQIGREVLELGSSVTVGKVHATFTSGRGSYDYEAIAAELGAPEEVVRRHTKSMVDWRKVVEEIGAPMELRGKYYTPGTPGVALKIRHET